MDAKTMGKFIAEMRKEKDMTQASLAQVLHVTSQAISKWERGIGFPDISTLQPLSVALGISLDELMNATKRPPEEENSSVTAIQNTISIAVQQLTDRKKLRFLVTEIILCVCGTFSLLHSALSFYSTYFFLYTMITRYWNNSNVSITMKRTPPPFGYACIFIGLVCFSIAIILMLLQFHRLRSFIKKVQSTS